MKKTEKNSIAEALQKAVSLHQAGDFMKADRLYDTVLKIDPANGDALNLKGAIAASSGRHDAALALFERAVAAMPKFAGVHFNKANALTALGRGDEALGAYTAAIALNPAAADARLNAGALLDKLGRLDDAVTAFRDMTRACPADARGHFNLALCLVKILDGSSGATKTDAITEALAAFGRACALNPGNAEAHFQYGSLLAKEGQHALAVTHLQSAAALRPDWPEAQSNLGEFLRRSGRFAEAVAAQRRAAALRADDPTITYNLATALCDAKEIDEAEDLFLKVIEALPQYAPAYVNLGNIYKDKNRVDDAIDMFEAALCINPTLQEAYSNIGAAFADKGWTGVAMTIHDKALSLKGADRPTRFNRATVVLTRGLFSEGWGDYEYRFEAPKERNILRSAPPVYWGGEDLRGKSIVVWTEQGLGDEILYASILGDVVARAHRCVIECSPRLAPVFARSFPAAKVVAYTSSEIAVTPAAGIDYQIPIASLGRHFRPDFASFPKHQGYLKADPAKVRTLRARYEQRAAGRKIVGLSWRSVNARIGTFKSLNLADCAPILTRPDIMFVNLQYGDCTEELRAVKDQLGVEVFDDPDVNPLTDMEAFFAQVAAMDLVITTSNTAAHVAGALSVPVWILLPRTKGSLWYWFLKRQDSPWYPSATLLRSATKNPATPWWHDAISHAASKLADII